MGFYIQDKITDILIKPPCNKKATCNYGSGNVTSQVRHLKRCHPSTKALWNRKNIYRNLRALASNTKFELNMMCMQGYDIQL